MKEGDWIGVLLGRVVVPPSQHRPPYWRTNFVQKQVWFSSFHLEESTIPLYLKEIRRRGLQFLEGYPSTLYILAKHLLGQGETLPLQAAFTSSETLHRIQREAIEAAFECELFDYYGHAERTLFASECEAHQGKHLAESFGYAEVVDGKGRKVADGEVGYLVGTTLSNTAFPLIRYKTSDLSAIIPEECACGRSQRRIEDITTKAEDIVITPDGRFISPSVLTHPFKPYPQILESQIVQRAPDRLHVRVVAGGAFGPEHEKGLLEGLAARLGSGVHVEVERVEQIPREPSGKFRWVISEVDHDLRVDWNRTADPRSSGA